MASKARDGKPSPEWTKGGTFQVTNVGVYGSLFGVPIPSPPHAANLALNTVKKRAVVNGDNEIVARDMMYTGMTYDHRILDGKDSGPFLVEIQKLIEEPERLLLDL